MRALASVKRLMKLEMITWGNNENKQNAHMDTICYDEELIANEWRIAWSAMRDVAKVVLASFKVFDFLKTCPIQIYKFS